MKIKVFHPGIESDAAGQGQAAAPAAARNPVTGKLRLALLDNTKVNSFELMEAIARKLGDKVDMEVSRWRKRHAGDSGADVIAKMMVWKPDLVLTGLGD